MSVEEYMKYAEKVVNSGLISIETSVGDDDDNDTKLWQIIAINDDTPDKYVEQKQLKKILADAISKLEERERLVITLYYYEELTMKEIGEILGLTESRISQIHTKTMLKLRRLICKYFNKNNEEE
jgi:RNA polymerase sigma factor for flagellar operon FliA